MIPPNELHDEIIMRAKLTGWRENDLLFVREESGKTDIIVDNGEDAWLNGMNIYHLFNENGRIYWDWRKGTFLQASNSTFVEYTVDDAPAKWIEVKDTWLNLDNL